MQYRLHGARISALAMALALSACGGGDGGVNSTPTPSPTPAPTPSPTPTPTNDDLIAPLVSQNFPNLSARASAEFHSDETTSGSVANQIGTIRYDAATQSYIVTGKGGTLTFKPSEIDASQSSDAVTAYVKAKSGSVADSLAITKAGLSGHLTYQYVGSAFWQHTEIGNTSGRGSIDAYVYGVPSAADAVPRTGNAYYDVDLIGAETIPTGVAPLAGTGAASVYFDLGKIAIVGKMNGVYFSGSDILFYGDATLASNENAFSGTFKFSDAASFLGPLQGEFFGPASDEIGATFGASAPDGRVAIGTIMGRKGGAGVNFAVNDLKFDQDFVVFAPANLVNEDVVDRSVIPFLYRSGNVTTLHYSASPASWSYKNSFADSVSFEVKDGVVSSDGRFVGYRNGEEQTLYFYKPESQNAEIALTYSSFGYYERVSSNARPNAIQTYREYFGYGIPTTSYPSGTATYTATLSGMGVSPAQSYDLSGSAQFSVNFSSGAALTGSLAIDGASRQNGAMVDFGSFPLTATLSSGRFDGNIDYDRFKWAASIHGGFFGPYAAEIAGAFDGIEGVDPAYPSDQVFMVGAFAGKRD